MSDELIPIRRKDDESLSLSFTRKQFSDFVFTHIQTPSEESRTYEFGFDVNRDIVKRIVDRLDYYVKTNNDLINTEFSVTVYNKNNNLRKINSHNDFFNIDMFESEFSNTLSVTISYLIGFGRANAPSTPEKQIVNFRFDAGDQGSGVVEIRSTEFSWPSAIFDLIKREFDDLQNEVARSNPPSRLPLLGLHSKISKLLSFFGERSNFLFMSTLMFPFLAFGLFFRDLFGENGLGRLGVLEVYDHKSDEFRPVELDWLLRSDGWRVNVGEVRDSNYLKELMSKSLKDLDVFRTLAELIAGINVGYWFICLFLLFLGFLNIREHIRLRANKIGRIWLARSALPERIRLKSSEGAVEAVFLSIFGTLFLAGIIQFWKLIISS